MSVVQSCLVSPNLSNYYDSQAK